MKREKRPRKHRIRNLSLRMSFMLYVVVFAVIGVVLVTGAVVWFSGLREDLYVEYAQIYHSDNLEVRFSARQDMPEEAWEQYQRYEMMMVLSVPAGIVFCLVSASYLFYRNKLRAPIRILTGASEKIARNDLDFAIVYDRRDEMGRLCDSFEAMRAALLATHREMWRAMAERKRVSAAFSHDLRTPLTVLHGYADMLRRHLPRNTVPPEKVEETLAAMSAQIERLERYVQNMNTLQRLEDVRVLPKPVDTGALADALRDAATMLCEADKKALRFENALPARQVTVDLQLVLQVAENLLSNAARYAKGEVRIHVTAAEDAVSVTVSDDGPGFTDKTLERATEPFFCGDEADGTHFGLGLNIASVLCARHGGSLSVSNGPMGGAQVMATFSEKTGPM